jgi:membrane protein
MAMDPRIWFELLRRAYADWNKDDAPGLGAALAFYTILSISPLVILVVAAAALIFSRSTAEFHLLNQVQRIAGSEGREAVQSILISGQKEFSGIVATLVGLITLVFGASAVFGELRSALNTIWEVKPEKTVGMWKIIKGRIFSFGIVLSVGFLLLVSLVVSAGLEAATNFSSSVLSVSPVIIEPLNVVFSLIGITVLFGFLLKYLPEADVRWRDVRLGAALTALLFTIGKSILAFYLGKESPGSAYGAVFGGPGDLGVLLRANFLFRR